MGHTLVTHFDAESRRLLHELMDPLDTNKIPFGRNCDREAANAAMDYHMTVFHWAKQMDGHYLECIRDFVPRPCQIRVTGTQILRAEEGSWLLCFTVEPTESYLELAASLERRIQRPTAGFLHITLAVSMARDEIVSANGRICGQVRFPFILNVDGLDLYHIWRPTGKVRFLQGLPSPCASVHI